MSRILEMCNKCYGNLPAMPKISLGGAAGGVVGISLAVGAIYSPVVRCLFQRNVVDASCLESYEILVLLVPIVLCLRGSERKDFIKWMFLSSTVILTPYALMNKYSGYFSPELSS